MRRISNNECAGDLQYILQIIPVLKELGYTDMHLYYEDCNVWVLYWIDPKLTDERWVLVDWSDEEKLATPSTDDEDGEII